LPSSVFSHPMNISASSVASAIPISPPPLPTNLPPRSSLCVFLGYSPHHKGYICFDLQSNRIIISRHVIFDETSFPFATNSSPPPVEDFEFLEELANPVTVPFPSISPPAGTRGPLPVVPGRDRSSSGPSSPGGSLPPMQQPPPDGLQRLHGTSPAPAASPAVVPAPSLAAPVPPPPQHQRFGIVYTRRNAAPPRSPQAGSPTAALGASPPPPPTMAAHGAPTTSTPMPSPSGSPASSSTSALSSSSSIPDGVVPVPPIINKHAMRTRGKHGFRVPAIVRTMCGSRTGGWSLPCVMSD
jgi:hypothetical protein